MFWRIFVITLAKRTCHGSSVWEWATVTNTTERERKIMCSRSCRITSTISAVTSLERSWTCDPTISTPEEQRSALTVSGLRSLGWREWDDWRRERETDTTAAAWQKRTTESCSRTHTHTHTHTRSCFMDRIGQMEDLKRAAFIYSQISEKVILHQLRQLDTHTHTQTALRSSWGKQLPKMTFQGFVFHIQNRKHWVCVWVRERERERDRGGFMTTSHFLKVICWRAKPHTQT